MTRHSRDGRKADLHLHSTHSDGLWDPERVVEMASRHGVAALSLTDHDTCDGLAAAALACERLAIDFIPGVEISVEHPEAGERHLLAYGIDPAEPALLRALQGNVTGRAERLHRMLDALAGAGVRLDAADVLVHASGSVGRPHVADALVRKGFARSRQEAFDRWLADGKVGHVKKPNVDVAEAIRCVHGAGGVAVLAHPGRRWNPDVIEDLVRMGLDGVEAWHPSHGRTHVRALEDMARRWSLLVTGGSDCHGDAEGQANLRGHHVALSAAEGLAERIAVRARAGASP